MERKTAVRNILTTMILQAVTILSGFIVPRIILTYFGSEVNGLVGSVNQFLNYVDLLEGGVGGVVTAALYKPLREKDYGKVSRVVSATSYFFRRIALISVAYMLLLAVFYPRFVETGFSYGYAFALVLVLGMNLFVQYFFSLTYRILLKADRKVWIVSLAQSICVVLNIAAVLLAADFFHDILIIKLLTAVIFFLQPLFFGAYIRKHYPLDPHAEKDQQALKQRWDGFAINLAAFIHNNTDIVILTVFSTLTQVSVYHVHFLVISAVKKLVMSVSQALEPSFGTVLAGGSREKTAKAFDLYAFVTGAVSAFAFTCEMLLLSPFIAVYTSGVTDADYHQVLFGVLLSLAEFVYCFRDSYIVATYAAGKFRETSKYAAAEAVLNIAVSLMLVRRWGITGVAVGTLFAMTVRMLMTVFYLKRTVLFRPVRKFWKSLLVFGGYMAAVSGIVCRFLPLRASGYFSWFLLAFETGCIAAALLLAVCLLFYRAEAREILGRRPGRKKS